jgi:RNA pol II accessory factor, Cdc73 family, C-terminal
MQLTSALTELFLRAQGAADGNFLETFANISAFFVRFDSDPAPDFVKKWSVNTLVVSKNTRHSDKSVIDGFWTMLDGFLARKRSTLAF